MSVTLDSMDLSASLRVGRTVGRRQSFAVLSNTRHTGHDRVGRYRDSDAGGNRAATVAE